MTPEDVEEDAWLAAVIGRPVFKVAPHGAAAAAAHVRREGSERAFYFAKVASDDVARANALADVGFFVADVSVTFGAGPAAVQAYDAPGLEVTVLRDGMRDQVLAIASSSFRFSRFHLDPLVDPRHADRIKEEWVRSYAEGRRGDRLFVAVRREDAAPVGFLAALRSSEGAAVIDLVGVTPDAQRGGVGRALVSAFARHYGDVPEVLVGTQVANVPSVRLYESMGFRFKGSQYVMHMHVRGGCPVRS